MARITILTTLYNSAHYVEELYARTIEAVNETGCEYEFVFVDDGSPDDGGAIVRGLIERDPRVRLVELSRNFGHHRAVMAGLRDARGDYVFMFDSDLEEDPSLLVRFWGEISAQPDEVDMVYGVMSRRRGSLLERVPGALFYKLINVMADVPVRENQMAARLMNRRYVDALLEFQEANVWLAGIMRLNGFHQVAVPSEKSSKGSSAYTWGRKFSQAADALLSFTNKPLTYVAGLGLTISAVALVAGLFLVGRLMMADEAVEGWQWVLASLWLLGGLIISSVGLVGFYVGRIFYQVKGRPNAIVRRVYERSGDE